MGHRAPFPWMAVRVRDPRDRGLYIPGTRLALWSPEAPALEGGSAPKMSAVLPPGSAVTELPKSRQRRGSPASSSVRSALAGPLREVVYIFEREGARGGAFWWLVLECGHAGARSRRVPKSLFEPLERHLAPRHVQCRFCASGVERQDPWILVREFGGEG